MNALRTTSDVVLS